MIRTSSFGIGAALVLVTTVLSSGRWGLVTAQADPSSMPLLVESNLQYIGGFRLPAGELNGEHFSFGGGVVAFNPAGPSLFVSGYRGPVAEVSIPTPVNSADVNAMPFASYLQPFADLTEGHLADVATDGVGLSGLMVYGNRLVGTAWILYHANIPQA